jgi:hypothetical protein
VAARFRAAAAADAGRRGDEEREPDMIGERKILTAEITGRTAEGLPSTWLTTDGVDAMDDRVIQSGLVFRDPLPILFSHQYSELPVGQATPDLIQRGPHRTRLAWRWLEGDARASAVRNAFEQNMLGASVGMRVLDSTPNAFGGYDITRAEVIEGSLTATPANPECTRFLKSLGLVGRGVTSCPAATDCPNVDQREVCPAGRLCPMTGPARTSWRDERTVRILDDREPVWRVDAAEFAAAWQLAVADVVTATYNRLKGRAD